MSASFVDATARDVAKRLQFDPYRCTVAKDRQRQVQRDGLHGLRSPRLAGSSHAASFARGQGGPNNTTVAAILRAASRGGVLMKARPTAPDATGQELVQLAQELPVLAAIEHDDTGKPVDCSFLRVNHAFAESTGLGDVTGKHASEVVADLLDQDPLV